MNGRILGTVGGDKGQSGWDGNWTETWHVGHNDTNGRFCLSQKMLDNKIHKHLSAGA